MFEAFSSTFKIARSISKDTPAKPCRNGALDVLDLIVCWDTNKVHFIFQHRNPVTGQLEEKHLVEAPVALLDQATHLYTLVVRPDQSFTVLVDRKVRAEGSLLRWALGVCEWHDKRKQVMEPSLRVISTTLLSPCFQGRKMHPQPRSSQLHS